MSGINVFSMASTSALKDLCRAAIVASDIDKLKAVLNDNRGILFLNSVERDEKLTCLMIAALEGSLAVCKLLVESKCDPNVQNNDGQSALMFAAYKGRLDVVDFLLTQDATVDQHDNNGYSAVDFAATKQVCSRLKGMAIEEVDEEVDSSGTERDSMLVHRNNSLSHVFASMDELTQQIQRNLTVCDTESIDYPSMLRVKQQRLADCEDKLAALQLKNDRLSAHVIELSKELIQSQTELQEQREKNISASSAVEELRQQVEDLQCELKESIHYNSENTTRSSLVSTQEEPSPTVSTPSESPLTELFLTQQRFYDAQLMIKDKEIVQYRKILMELTAENSPTLLIASRIANESRKDMSKSCIIS